MKLLVVARHGEYMGDELDDEGRRQIRALAEKLKPVVKDREVLILSSTAKRASQSAEILKTALHAPVHEYAMLWSATDQPTNLPKALELVRSCEGDVDVLILVTHLEYSADFPAYYAREVLQTRLCSDEIEKGEAWYLDCVAKTLAKDPPNLAGPAAGESDREKGVLFLTAHVACADCGQKLLIMEGLRTLPELLATLHEGGWRKTKHGWVCGCARRNRKKGKGKGDVAF